MKQNKNLPDWCQILDGLNSEIAEERSQSKEGHGEVYNRNTRLKDLGSVDVACKLAPTPTLAVKHPPTTRRYPQ